MNRTVLIADDHALVRAGLAMVVRGIEGFDVVGEAANGREAIDVARQLHPDVALLDVTMPGLNGLDAIEPILRDSPATRIVVLSMHASGQYVGAALRAGASAYVIKDCAVDELAQALVAVVEGRFFVSPAVSGHVLAAINPTRSPAADDASLLARLSHRQREVLQLLAEGRATREIAGLLNLSAKTVETHRAELMRRLQIFDVASLTRFAIRSGLISPER